MPDQAKRAAETAQGRLDVAVDTIADGFALGSRTTPTRCNRRFLDLFPNQRGMIRPGLHFEDFVAAVVSDGGVLDARRPVWLAATPRRSTTANPKAA